MRFHLVLTPQDDLVLSGELVTARVGLSGVDWEREVPLVIDLGEQRTAGYRVEVLNAAVTDDREVRLRLQLTSPRRGHFVAQVLTRPYAVVRLPRERLAGGPVRIVAFDQTGAEVARQEAQA